MKKTLSYIPKGGRCIEIGVWKGEFAREILSIGNIAELYLVDPWESIPDVPERWHAAPQERMDQIYQEVANNFLKNEKVKIIREFSKKACKIFGDEYFDWLYLDANHSYEFVKEDLKQWWPKIKLGGFFCGDDYQEGKYQVEVLDFGVVKAVDEFVKDNHDEIEFCEIHKDQFIIKKKSHKKDEEDDKEEDEDDIGEMDKNWRNRWKKRGKNDD
jgi:hypothetical protein